MTLHIRRSYERCRVASAQLTLRHDIDSAMVSHVSVDQVGSIMVCSAVVLKSLFANAARNVLPINQGLEADASFITRRLAREFNLHIALPLLAGQSYPNPLELT